MFPSLPRALQSIKTNERESRLEGGQYLGPGLVRWPQNTDKTSDHGCYCQEGGRMLLLTCLFWDPTLVLASLPVSGHENIYLLMVGPWIVEELGRKLIVTCNVFSALMTCKPGYRNYNTTSNNTADYFSSKTEM